MIKEHLESCLTHSGDPIKLITLWYFNSCECLVHKNVVKKEEIKSKKKDIIDFSRAKRHEI